MTMSPCLGRVNPVAKFVGLICICTIALQARNPVQAASIFGFVLAGHVAAGAGLGSLWRRLRGILIFGIAVFASQMLFGRGLSWAERAASGGVMALRFLNIIFSSHLFVSTTTAEDFAYALMQAGLPYRYGFTLLTAMRFVPYFRLQANTVTQAQMARGIAVDRPTPRGICNMARFTIMPVIVTALSKVDGLAISMEGRCFGLYPSRTFVRRVPFRWSDAVLIAVSLATTATALMTMTKR
ncbi:MAG: energy-coupling factor transporter transmembrane component T [Clostridia bacterium]|nr:energy-coupling factor transporter transmembrane component T [Clostridia bacterium]